MESNPSKRKYTKTIKFIIEKKNSLESNKGKDKNKYLEKSKGSKDSNAKNKD
jgi:hypothetical protein